jgi:hypothetical protein
MVIVLYLVAVALGFSCALGILAADNATDLLLAALIGLGACVLFCGAAILDTLNAILARINQADRNAWNIGLAQCHELRNPEALKPAPQPNEEGHREP